MDRNGLGPSKEGEAQYSVVHCTGYIKAWPPAGLYLQPPCWWNSMFHRRLVNRGCFLCKHPVPFWTSLWFRASCSLETVVVSSVHWSVVSGMTIPEEDTESSQVSKYCLVAIGRLQVGLSTNNQNVLLSLTAIVVLRNEQSRRVFSIRTSTGPAGCFP